MLCMETYGRIAPMVHVLLFEGPGAVPGRGVDVLFIIRPVSAGGYSRTQETAGGDPVGFPRPNPKRIKSKEL